ncbi:MAG: hypothetical protein FWF15_11905 [Oscillospiraceae bacterium]|nr:hypothetical protein [Oscillospiraceae bacterium]
MKRFISLIIIIIVILTACQNGSDNDKTSETKNNSDETQRINETEILPVLPEDADYEGYEFRVVTRGDERHSSPLHTRDIYADEQNGESINDAVYLRNRTVEDMFNVKIVMYALNEDDERRPNNAVQAAVLADEDLYDLLMTHEIYAAPTAQNGYLMNLANIPYIDLSKPWWDKSATNDLSVGNKIFLALSDFSVSTSDYAHTILFNKQLQEL